MTIEETNFLIEKSKTKKNGIYKFKGNFYVVKNGIFIGYSDSQGNTYERFGNFNVFLVKLEINTIKNKLKERFLNC